MAGKKMCDFLFEISKSVFSRLDIFFINKFRVHHLMLEVSILDPIARYLLEIKIIIIFTQIVLLG